MPVTGSGADTIHSLKVVPIHTATHAHDGCNPAVSQVLDALDASYATPLDGTGLFPLQATLNHSCEPNVTLMKEGQEENDGRVVARTTREVAEGEELCNACAPTRLERRRRVPRLGGVPCAAMLSSCGQLCVAGAHRRGHQLATAAAAARATRVRL